MKRILVAIDYDIHAQLISIKAQELAKALSAELIILHVVQDVLHYSNSVVIPVMGFGGFHNINFLSKNAVKEINIKAKLFVECAKRYLGNQNIRILIKRGNVLKVIMNIAQINDVDIIVIGCSRNNLFKELFVENIAKKVLRKTTIPLYIIPNKAD